MKERVRSQRRLLSIDGGGLRGMIAVRVLARIEAILREQSGKPDLVLADYFDYIGGTSTGGIIAAALAIGMSVSELEDFYRKDGPRLFSPTRNPIKRFGYIKYDSRPLAGRLKEVFGAETTLGSDRIKTLLMLVMLNASTSSPWPISNNPKAKYNDPAFGAENNLNLPLWQLIKGSAAAPYFFEPEEIQIGSSRFIFYDGAITSLNNPAFKLFQMATLPGYRLQWPTGEDRMLLVSVGTGMLPQEIKQPKWYERQAGSTLLKVTKALLFAGTAEVDMQCRTIGKVLTGDPIDSEVGDFVGNHFPTGIAQFTYLRYNALLTERGLTPYGCANLLKQTAFGLGDANAIEPCAIVGDAIVEKRVKAEHFASFPYEE